MNRGMYGIQEEEIKDKKETKGVRSESRHSSRREGGVVWVERHSLSIATETKEREILRSEKKCSISTERQMKRERRQNVRKEEIRHKKLQSSEREKLQHQTTEKMPKKFSPLFFQKMYTFFTASLSTLEHFLVS